MLPSRGLSLKFESNGFRFEPCCGLTFFDVNHGRELLVRPSDSDLWFD